MARWCGHREGKLHAGQGAGSSHDAAQEEGLHPDDGDREWRNNGPDLKEMVQGKAERCSKRHTRSKDNDDVVLAPLKK